MHQSYPLRGAAMMVGAGLCFALANALTQIVTSQLGFRPQSDSFWQYAIALVLALPFLRRHGFSGLKTTRPGPHLAPPPAMLHPAALDTGQDAPAPMGTRPPDEHDSSTPPAPYIAI